MRRERDVIRPIISGIVHKGFHQAQIVRELQRSVIMKNKARLYARRREMYHLYVQKKNMTEILDKLSVKYSISKQALWQDWQKRTYWVYDVFDLEPARARHRNG
jgi:hypothetical protein